MRLYKAYMELGFTRVESHDNVVYQNTGYGGFTLVKQVAPFMEIGISHDELDSPKLYIHKKGSKDSCHIIALTPEQVIDIFYKLQ